EPMLRKNRSRYCAPTGFPVNVPVRSVKMSAAAGGDVKSLRLTVQLGPPWQLAQPACRNRPRPAATSAAEEPLGRLDDGALGVRTAKRTHSRKAVNAGTFVLLPGKVTVTWGRFALGNANALIALGATLRS